MQKPKSRLTSSAESGIPDKNHRIINYLRISVTDRCNLRCIYCMPDEGIEFLPHNEILTYEEMLRVARLCVLHGIKKVRLTGGEPLVRKGVIPFIERLCAVEGLEEITLTTNGVLLKDFARPLRECGIYRVNVSMDTLRPERFLRITGRDYFHRVWEGIAEAESAGLSPIKINVVAMKGLNDDEILDFARITYEKPYHIRFIEMMPVGERSSWTAERFLPVDEILGMIQVLGPLRRVDSQELDGPAQRYVLKGAKGEIGLISALSNHFCDTCNRLRLTADGCLMGCIFSDRETDIKTPLRNGEGDGYLLNLIINTIKNKPKGHNINMFSPKKCVRPMNRIGG